MIDFNKKRPGTSAVYDKGYILQHQNYDEFISIWPYKKIVNTVFTFENSKLVRSGLDFLVEGSIWWLGDVGQGCKLRFRDNLKKKLGFKLKSEGDLILDMENVRISNKKKFGFRVREDYFPDEINSWDVTPCETVIITKDDKEDFSQGLQQVLSNTKITCADINKITSYLTKKIFE
jgi:hypothetical protein